MRPLIAFTVISLFAAPLHAQAPVGTTGDRSAWSGGLAVLATSAQAEEPGLEGRLPSLRATLAYQHGRYGWHVGGLRVATSDVGLWALVAGARLNLVSRSRVVIAPFVEAGYGPYARRIDPSPGSAVGGRAVGGGAGLLAEIAALPWVALDLVGGYWRFHGPELDLAEPVLGLGLRLSPGWPSPRCDCGESSDQDE